MKPAITNPWTFITLCLVLPVTAYTGIKWYDVFYQKPPVVGRVERACLQNFTTQYNTPAQNVANGKLTVVNFFFTSCPVICPKMMKSMKTIHDQFANYPDIQFVSITVDPERDTHERLQWYIQKMRINDKAWQIIRGKKSDTYILARNQFNLVAADANENSDFIHSDKLILVDASGNIRGYYSGLEKSAINQLIIDIKKLRS
jgi:protein SCO1/2